MLNLLSGEFYKLKKSKSFLVCCMVMIVAVIFLYGTLFLADKIQQGEITNGTSGVVITSEVNTEGGSIFDSLGVSDVFQQIAGNFGTMIPAIFTAIFVIGEFGNGAIKNLVGKGYFRAKIFLAKYITSSVAAVVIVFTGAVATVICGGIFMGADALSSTYMKAFVIYTLLETGLVVALNGIIVTISEMSRSMGIGISAGIGVVMFSSFISGGMDLLLHRFGFRFSDYWMTDLMSNYPLSDFGGKIIFQIVMTIIVWSVLAIGAGVWHFGRTDVK